MANKTRIRRLVMEVKIPSEKDLEPLNQNAKDFIYKSLQGLIQRLVNELNPNTSYIIETIEIDLGEINFQNPQNMINSFIEQFRKQLAHKKKSSKVSESYKYENAILQFIDRGRLPWWLDKTEDLNVKISKKKFSLTFLDKIRSLIMDSDKNFFRLQNLLGDQGLDYFLKQILGKNHPFYSFSLRLVERLSEKTRHKWNVFNFNKSDLKHSLVKGFIGAKPDKKKILLIILKKLAEQTGQDFDGLFGLSPMQPKYKNNEFNRILSSLSKENLKIQTPQDLTPSDATPILLSYLKNGFDFLPPGYANMIVIDSLLKTILVNYKKQFLQRLKFLEFNDNELFIQRLMSLLNRSNISVEKAFLTKTFSSSFSEIISFVKSSQIINLLERQKLFFAKKSLDNSILKFVIQQEVSGFSNQIMLEQFLKFLAEDFGLAYSDLIQEMFISFKSGIQKKQFTSYLDNIYNEEVISKYDYKPIFSISQEEGDFETNLKLNFFQRESFYYFANLFAKKPFFRFFESHFDKKKNLLILISEEIKKIQGADFVYLTKKLLTVLAKKTATDISDLVDQTILFINDKHPKDSFDYQILAKLTREQYQKSKDDNYPLKTQLTLFRYDLEKELSILEEDTVVLFLSLFNQFKKNESFRNEFPSPIEFEKFLVGNIYGSPITDIELLIENLFSKISLATKLSFSKIINIALQDLTKKKKKTYFEIILIRKYNSTQTKFLSKNDQLTLTYQDFLNSKKLSFHHIKIILFLFNHLERFSITQSFKRIFKTKIKLLEFLAKDFKFFSSNYKTHANLIVKLALKLNISYHSLVDEIIASINSKSTKVSLDYEFTAFFDPKIRKVQIEPASEKVLYYNIGNQLPSTEYKLIKSYELFFKVFLSFKNKKKYNSVYPTDVDIANFLSEQFKIHSDKSFEEQIDLFFVAFGQTLSMSLTYLFAFAIEKLLIKQDTDELSNRLLSKMILKLIEINQPRFSFGTNASSIKKIDDLLIKLASLKKVYPSQFLMLVYYPKVLSQLKPESFIKVIQILADHSKINPLWIDQDLNQIIKSLRGPLKERFRFVLLKILLDSKPIISQQFFLKLIEQHLLRHDPNIIERGIINQEFKEAIQQGEETKFTTIKKIINLLSVQKENFISRLEESSSEFNQFEYLLQYKNDIMVANDKENKKRIQKELDNFELIISSSESLLFFLNTYTDDLELILSFTELALTNEYLEKVNQKIDHLSKKFLVLEKRLIELQTNFRFSNLEKDTFKILLRALIFKNIGRYKTAKNFNISDFTYGFFEHLSRERHLNIKAVNQILTPSESDPILLDIHRALNIFSDRGVYFGISKKIRDEIYFKDLSFAVLRDGKLPEWSMSETFTSEDALGYVISKIEDQDFDFTSKFISSLPISDSFLEAIAEKPLKFYISLFQQIKTSSQGYDLGLKFQELVNYFSKNPWNSEDDVQKVLSQFVLRDAIWRSNSLIIFSEKLYNFLKGRADTSKTKLKNDIYVALGINASISNLKLPDLLKPEEKIELIRYFIELGFFPDNFKGGIPLVKKELSFILEESPLQAKQLLRSYLNRPEAVKNILKILSLRQLNKIIKLSFFQGTFVLEVIGDALFSVMNKGSDTPQKLPILFNLIHMFFIEKEYKDSSLEDFFTRLENVDKVVYSKLVNEFLIIRKSDKFDTSSYIFGFLSRIDKIGDLTYSFKSKKNDLDRLEYYVEFGSTNFDDIILSISDFYSIFQKLQNQEELLIKKRLHQWGNSRNKIRRIIKLYPENKIKSLFDFIHPDLVSFLDALDSVLIERFKSSLPMALGLDKWEGLIIYNFGYWSSKNLILYSLKDFIQTFLIQILSQLQISKQNFILELKNSTHKTSNVVKRSLIDWTLQLDASPVENKKKGFQLQELSDKEGLESLLVENAGLVLLWPFLSRLFDKLNLLENGGFIDNESQQKAILLSEYLVIGKTEFQESFLSLNKIICGAPPDMFVDINLSLQKFELELCESLLNSVIKNWEKIENSSISTLRESFLIRQGTLSKFGSDFNLKIEKKAFDVLLDTLPWNISMIQTSFMKNRILVDWR